MRLKFVQKIVDKIWKKRNKQKFASLQEGVKYLSAYFQEDKVLQDEIINGSVYFKYQLKNKEAIVKKYLDSISVENFPLAKGSLRNYQNELVTLIKDVVFDMERNGITPLMTGGTLLGAVRHGGFIPWDDDIDFDIVGDEYEKCLKYIDEKCLVLDTRDMTSFKDFYTALDKMLSANPNQIVWARKPHGLCVYRGTSLSDAKVLDFFRIDYIAENVSKEELVKYRLEKEEEYRACKNWGEKFSFMDRERKNSGLFSSSGTILARAWESFSFVHSKITRFFLYENVLPSVKIDFEDIKLYTYSNYELILSDYFPDYMKIPVYFGIAMHIKNLAKKCKENNKDFYISIDDILKGI